MSIPALVVATALSYPLGLASGSPWLLPSLNALPAYLTMTQRLRSGDRHGAVVAMLAWALTMAVVGVLAFSLWPTPPGATVLNGVGYRDEMFAWIATGIGREGSVRLFLPQHLLHLAIFVAIALASASAGAILMGAVLMNFMNFYVASLHRAGAPLWAVLFLGWQPWAICRVAAFATLGAVLAEPLLSRLLKYKYGGLAAAHKYLAAAAAGIALDWILKAAFAPAWGRALRAVLHFGAS